MNEFLYIIPRAVIIGVLVSAPMGPVGVLCIQRTLNKGRGSGFFTGVGAAFSDIFYCLITGLGLSFVTDFISKNQYILQIIGSGVIIAYAMYLFVSNPSKQLKSPDDRGNNYFKDFYTGFLFTVSNPLIIFLIIGLLARFNIMKPDYNIFHLGAGYIAIFLGAILWWWFITLVVNKLRKRFNLRSMRIMNRVIAIVLFTMACFGIASGIKYYVMDVFHLL